MTIRDEALDVAAVRDEDADEDRRIELLGLVSGFHDRTARPLGVRLVAAHHLKLYALEAPGRHVPTSIVTGVLDAIEAVLADHAAHGTCGLGFVVLHAGADGDYLLVQTWSPAYMSQLTILIGALDAPTLLTSAPATLSACVWEARLIAHERDAFAGDVLAGNGPLDERIERWERDVLPAGPVR